jgi:hypothetical protein
MRQLLCVALLLALGCSEKKPEPLKNLAPKPLPVLTAPEDVDGGDREAAYRVKEAPVYGEPMPEKAVRFKLEAGGVRVDSELINGETPEGSAKLKAIAEKNGAILLEPMGEVFVAQAAAALAVANDARAEVFLAHPNGKVAFEIFLRDEPAFQKWIDEPKPGKLRVIHRADGFELQTNIGKLPGADPNGPSVPRRGGQWDISLLRTGFVRLKERFSTSPDVCFVPSFGMELSAVAAALTANYEAMGEPIFDQICLVYPRPKAR